MRMPRLSHLFHLPRIPHPSRREPGQILILTALFLIVLLVLGGSAYDYGSIVTEDQQLQNAADAAGLAGSNALANAANLPVNTAIAVAEATSREYLRINGYATTTPGVTISYAFPTSTPIVVGGTPSPIRDNIVLTVNKVKPTYFWLLVGVNNVNINATSGATAGRGLVDIMLTLDTTGSMGTTGIAALRLAVRDFVNQMNPSTGDPRGPKIGVARFQGLGCQWWKGTAGGPPGDGDRRIDRGATVATDEYREPCTDQYTVLSNLSDNKAALIKIADNSGGGSCPVSTSLGACPINDVDYVAPVAAGHGATTTPIAWQQPAVVSTSSTSNSRGSPPIPGGTGTKLDAGITAVNRTGYYAWSCTNGGRNNCSGEGWAKKVLIYMTDGDNNVTNIPISLGSPETAWDTEFANEANALKLGPDGTAGTNDDVEIYVVGYYDSAGVSTLVGINPRPCPSATLPPSGQRSAVDNLLIGASSSTPGSCDHFYPLNKTESLPQLFAVLASKIARGRLTQ